MSAAAGLFARLEDAIRRAVAAGEIGTARSLRLHVGAPADELPDAETLLGLGDALFMCGRTRLEQSSGAVLCVWEHGQVATMGYAPSTLPIVVLTVVGSDGALHFQQGGA
jgi:hypothetical protein